MEVSSGKSPWKWRFLAGKVISKWYSLTFFGASGTTCCLKTVDRQRLAIKHQPLNEGINEDEDLLEIWSDLSVLICCGVALCGILGKSAGVLLWEFNEHGLEIQAHTTADVDDSKMFMPSKGAKTWPSKPNVVQLYLAAGMFFKQFPKWFILGYGLWFHIFIFIELGSHFGFSSELSSLCTTIFHPSA